LKRLHRLERNATDNDHADQLVPHHVDLLQCTNGGINRGVGEDDHLDVASDNEEGDEVVLPSSDGNIADIHGRIRIR
jgi:hypothetical protein